MSGRERQLLALLARYQKLSLGMIADQMDLSLPYASRLASRLAEKGMLIRQHAEDDRRVILFSLSTEGRLAAGTTAAPATVMG